MMMMSRPRWDASSNRNVAHQVKDDFLSKMASAEARDEARRACDETRAHLRDAQQRQVEAHPRHAARVSPARALQLGHHLRRRHLLQAPRRAFGAEHRVEAPRDRGDRLSMPARAGRSPPLKLCGRGLRMPSVRMIF